MHVPRRVRSDPLQHVHEIDVGIDLVHPASPQQTLHHRHVLSPHLRPAKQPVLAAQSNRPDLALEMIGIQRDIGLLEKDLQGPLPVQRIVCRFGKRALG